MLKPNILFIVIDSLKADKINGENKTTTHIDSLIQNGINFSQAIGSTDGTELAWATIFTGLYPFKTGLNGNNFSKLPSKTISYFNILANYGYHTYATMPEGGFLFGLTRGFENVDKDYAANSRLYNGLDKKIIEKFESSTMKEPWIYFIHLLDLHAPILLPDKFNNEKYGSNSYERMISAIDAWLGKILQKIDLKNTLIVLTSDHGEYLPTVKDLKQTMNFTKTQVVGRLLWKIESICPQSLIPLRNKLFNKIRNASRQIKSAEINNLDLSPYEKRSLLNSRLDPQGYLYDEIVHIPLIFSGFGCSSKNITQQVRHVDIFPTIAEIVGCTDNKQYVDGKSLVPLIQGKKVEEEPVYMESIVRTKEISNAVIGVRTSKYKYFRSRENPDKRINLYDLEMDPLEENNVSHIHPDIVTKMETILSKLLKDTLPKNEREEMSEEETRKVELELRKLGYI